MIISLTGFMGSGKSSVGRELPALLSLPGGPFDFIDLDSFIVESEGMSVNEIFDNKGEGGFRHIETLCLERLLEQYEGRNLVLALGGGTTVFNPELIREKTLCFYLSASVDTLLCRLASDTSRPLLAGASTKKSDSSQHNLANASEEKAEPSQQSIADASTNAEWNEGAEELRNRIERLYSAREATYRSVAHHTIATDGLSVSTIASRIAGLFV